MPSRERLQTAPTPPTLLQVSYSRFRAGGAAKHVTLLPELQQQKGCNDCTDNEQYTEYRQFVLLAFHNRRLIGAHVTRMAKQCVMHGHTLAPGCRYLVALVAADLVAYAIADCERDSVAM